MIGSFTVEQATELDLQNLNLKTLTGKVNKIEQF